MFKIDLAFNTTLPAETLNKYCDEIDKLFIGEGAVIVDKSFGKRIYDVGNISLDDLLSPLIDIRENQKLRNSIVSGVFSSDDEVIDLIKDCFKLNIK